MPDIDDSQPHPAPTGAGPQRIAPAVPAPASGGRRGGKRGWVVASTIAVVGVLAALGVAGFVIARGGAENATESQVRDTVDTFVSALESGDLATLQSSTCGTLADFYRDIPPAEFADVHRDAVTNGGVPVVTNIDSIQVDGDSAIVQVTAHTQANPSDVSPRTFDLSRIDGDWKVCSPD
ncbi:hypothetical protein EGT67_07055 [Prescottella agglutinans]|uniref:DUF4878 domain-containing protein n=1 Tax=Prescottella agglutinans TaxID=1644129 RepID=A0A438BH77_9NOCA|nr:hypothetical protein [Prescottella agglutinans]RVW09985.1 hypothetical protein EGT67_07055 [Prescottella agglutinans]